MRVRTVFLPICVLTVAGFLAGCEPQDRRPGLWLSGELQPAAADWRFTNDYPEVALQVVTPYLLPHSITIVCAADADALYIGARDPASKNWPNWVDQDPDVILKVGEHRYELRAEPIAEADLAPVRAAYAAKYGARPQTGDGPPIRYWRLVAR